MPASAWAALASTRSEIAVDAGHVGHRVHHADVGRADVGLHVARRDGRHHHLGHADRQPRIAGVASAVPPEPPAEIEAAEIAPRHDEALEGHRHLASPPCRGRPVNTARSPLGMMARHLARTAPIAGDGSPEVDEIHRDRAQPELLQAVAQEAQLAPLGVERAGDVGGAAERGRHRAARRRAPRGRSARRASRPPRRATAAAVAARPGRSTERSRGPPPGRRRSTA